ncbi:hypothetical protein, partial [Paraclostridium dentum]|uniref:hypothetical protein n=1 Tax=Paraclostridium dentum TaxID=2662455 RepID=UPI0034643647
GSTSGASISNSVGASTPIGSTSGASVSNSGVGASTPIGSTSGASISNSVGASTPIGSTSGASVSNSGVGASTPIGSTSGASISNSVGASTPIPSSLRPNTSKIYKPSTIKLPKDVEIKPIEKPTSKTIADVAVSKYANMAEKIYNSPTLKGARNTYQVSKNSAMALKNNKEKDDNEKRD